MSSGSGKGFRPGEITRSTGLRGVPVTVIAHAQSELTSTWYGGAVLEMYSGAMSPPDLALPPNIVMATPFRS